MKKIHLNKRKILFGAVQLAVLGVICLGFLKYAEEIVEIKDQIRRKAYFEEMETHVDFSTYPRIEHVEDAWYEGAPLIYHAGGGIEGLDYTNSKEALQNTLDEGHRIVEIDFLYTADQKLVCAHFWKSLYEDGETIPTLKEFKEHKIFGKYSSMTAEELIAYMETYEDLYIIIDTKEENYGSVIADLVELSAFNTTITDRFVIQLYDENSKAEFLKLYPFKRENFLFTTYKYGTELTNRIMKICYEEDIAVIAITYGLWDQETIEKFREKGFIIYEYTVNRPNQANVSLEKGINSFYTDYLVEADLQR